MFNSQLAKALISGFSSGAQNFSSGMYDDLYRYMREAAPNAHVVAPRPQFTGYEVMNPLLGRLMGLPFTGPFAGMVLPEGFRGLLR